MKTIAAFLLLGTSACAVEPKVYRDLAYAEPKNERQTLDIYAPVEGKGHPVVFWIHGGGWVMGNKSSVQQKPQAFVRPGIRICLNQLSSTAARGHGDDHSRRREVSRLGPHTHRRVWRRSQANLRDGAFRRSAARRARQHR